MDKATLNDIDLLTAHANEALKIADRLRQKFQLAGVSTPATRKRTALSNEEISRLLAKKNKKRNQFIHLTNHS